ncbi:O-methyltransferase [Eremomyces bilateralis CBS 781.70]|uniref:O-methyltransferase n=1 Tax=Eremomyces bilateralis CBS 781.70 TaxID=1392243 RepID=A0A6G1GCW9_9PEZI|nr:O-methyltransferase [Eremomyces bilateralis CBS 781.70]KAF1815937.1 O-methyltransferase [Eremomyces bilateralis CBS 781.70]
MSSLRSLAQSILDNVDVIESCLEAKGCPPPSWDVNAQDWLSNADSRDLRKSRETVLSATKELHDLLIGPRELIQVMGEHHNDLISSQAIIRYGIANRIPIDKKISYAELAASCGIHEHVAQRLLRHAILRRLFIEPQPGMVAHNAVSRVLLEDEQMRDFLAVSVEDLWPAATKTVDALQKWQKSDLPHETGFTLANNSTSSIYHVLAAEPNRGMRFANSMGAYSANPTYSADHVLKGYPWRSLPPAASIVDIGGSHGSIPIALAKEFGDINFIIQDLPMIIESVPALPDEEWASRVKFMSHDFFTEQPVKDADIYYFRWIMHGYADSNAAQLLKHLIPALKPGARILINDYVLPEPGTVSWWSETRARVVDITQIEILNSRERELGEWKGLFAMTDPRFKMLNAWTPEGSALGFIEAVWQPEETKPVDM